MREGDAESWLLATLSHLEALRRRFRPDGFQSVYLGGGSPSSLPRNTLKSLLAALLAFPGPRQIEFSVELNPEDLDPDLLGLLADGGVDRLSLGVQSLEPLARQAAARRGEAGSILGKLETVARRWRGRWSFDLMYGLPGQTIEGISKDAALLAGLGAGHASLYELTLEAGTPMADRVGAGLLALPGEDEAADQYDAAAEGLKAAGMSRYEVSNWAIPGEECAHNEVYWEMGDWLALGPSGVGNIGLEGGSFLRLENVRDSRLYARDPTGSTVETVIEGDGARFEALMTALRTSRGLDLGRFEGRFGVAATSAFGNLPAMLPGLVKEQDGRWAATERGLDTLNSVLVEALSEMERRGGDNP